MLYVYVLRGGPCLVKEFVPFVIQNILICNLQYVTQTRDAFYMSLLDTGPIELSVALRAIPDRVLVSNLLSCQPPVKVDDTIEVSYVKTVVYYIHLLSKIYFEAISTRN